MTAETLASIAAVLVSLMFAYAPGLKAWFEGKPGETKAGIMGVVLVLVGLGAFGLACVGLSGDFGLLVTCDKSGAIGLVRVLIAALMANQATYVLAVKPFRAE